MNLLIFEPNAREIKETLEPKFPGISIHAAATESEVGDLIEKTDILLTIMVPDDLNKLFQKAFNKFRVFKRNEYRSYSFSAFTVFF